MEETQSLSKTKKKSMSSSSDIAPNSTEDKILTLIEDAIPLKRIVFHDTILSVGGNMGGEPEHALYDPSQKPKPARTAKLWYTPAGVVVKQKNNYKIIPLAAVKDNDVLL